MGSGHVAKALIEQTSKAAMIIELMNIVLAARLILIYLFPLIETSSENALCKSGVRSSNYPSPHGVYQIGDV